MRVHPAQRPGFVGATPSRRGAWSPRRFAGERPPPFDVAEDGGASDRPDDSPSDAAALLSPRTVRVERVVGGTPDAVTLVLEDPTGASVSFAPGQFFTLFVSVGDEILRRAYSASTDARETERVAITIKRVASGVVSNHVNDHVREGDLLQVLGPSGSFVVAPEPSVARHLVLLAGGSGITPMMAITRTVLAVEPQSRVTLVYGNRGRADVIFKDALDRARAHARTRASSCATC